MRMYVRLLNSNGMNISVDNPPRYIGIHVVFDDFEKINIGGKTTISDDCHLLTHDYSITNVMRTIGRSFPKDIAIVRNIEIGNNCFIGKKTIIMPGCSIGDNCIVGAGSVVRGKIPANSIVIGNPATVISTTNELAKKWSKYIEDDLIRKD